MLGLVVHPQFLQLNIRTIAVFGSYVRREQTPDSDVDWLVEFNHPPGLAFVDLADELEALLGTPVDLVSRGALSKRSYESIAPDLQYV
jgi:predicted nucleotidyltransferase